jgi:putative endonuclease
MFYTYIVTSQRNGTLYTGHTDDIAQRAYQHKTGQFPGFSKKYNCRNLVWYEEHATRDEAFKRERRIKNWKRAWKINLIEKDNPHWLNIMECPVWPLPKGDLYKDLRETALDAQTGSRPAAG